jgi:hypothetical protein
MSRFRYTPSTPFIKRALAVIDDTPTLVCLSCGDTKKHVRTILKFGVHPDMLVFVCPSCNDVETREDKGRASFRMVSM